MDKIPKINTPYLKKWLQDKFDQYDLKLIVKEGYRTRFREQDYEAGAAVYVFRVYGDDPNHCASVYCHLWPWEIEDCLKKGKKLVYKLRDGKYVQESEITVSL